MTEARMLLTSTVAALLSWSAAQCDLPALDPKSPDARQTVVVGKGLEDNQKLLLATAMAASEHPGVLLFDSLAARLPNRRFIDQYHPAAVVNVGESADGDSIDLEQVNQSLFPRAERLVVVNSPSRRMRLRAAELAVATRSPLVIWQGPEDATKVAEWVHRRGVREVFNVGDAINGAWPEVAAFTILPDEKAVQGASLKFQLARGPANTIIVANPADSGIAELAPWLCGQRRAVLLLTNSKGDDATQLVRQVLVQSEFRSVENLLLLARPSAIVPERRDNPIAGKDPFIEMEPATPTGSEPFTLATGRLFHDDAAMVPLILARFRLLPSNGSSRTALVASDPGGSLPLLETISQVSVRELKQRGYQTTALLGDQLSRNQLRQRLPEADLFLWEGHHNTLIKEWGFSSWDEPLRPSFIFLQSCLALTEEKVSPLFDRGAIAVLGSSSRIYSATGGAFSLAYLDALLYEGESLGGALRQSKNFLLAYSMLKEKRLGAQARMSGANIRSAWAFTLWGDPGLTLPAPAAPENPNAVRSYVRGNTITVTVSAVDGAAEVGKYRVGYRPNSRLAGMIRPVADDEKKLVPFVFAEVRLPKVPDNASPRLETKHSESSWTFLWDARRRVGYVLALPRDGARELKFHVKWDTTVSSNSGGGR